MAARAATTRPTQTQWWASVRRRAARAAVRTTGGSMRSAQTATMEPNTLSPRSSVPATPIACVAR
ncbi:hypothetical protein BSZ37_07795 [Rubrivirga marina]|uniref:Uncharacterized protein n=1 Tax=Rubrivirga marina TaxID=1196024 RepID=A0A271IYR0_9BACT|nr:hypothetical protein BSZ37_07795 [Rubrivirga marina]